MMTQAAAKVLVVDDLEDNRNVLSRRLSRAGCDVSQANGGREAIDSIRKNEPEVVLLDIMMPDMNGFDVIRKVRATQDHKQPSIIAVSARNDAEAITQALSLGANDYVTKPYDFNVVWARVDKQLNQMRSASLIRDVNTRLALRLHKQRSHMEVAGNEVNAAEDVVVRTILNAAKHANLREKLDHEVRSRCHEILDVADRLRPHGVAKPEVHEIDAARSGIEKTSLDLLTLLDDVNDFMTLQRGLPDPVDAEVNLRDAVLREWEALSRRCDMSAASIEILTADPKTTVQGNPGFVRKAIGAVLANAVRFNEKTPVVTVRLAPLSDKYYKISVEDNGIGISPELIDDVAAPFFQADNLITCKYGGLGIGLAIANQVVTLHKGDLKVTAGQSGEGTSVELSFPFIRPQDAM